MKFKLGWGRTRKHEWAQALQGLVLPNGDRTPEMLLREYVRQVRGNELVLSRDPLVASPGGPSGAWVTAGDTDLIWVHPAASGVQYGHIIGHEVGHMVNGDEPDPLDLATLFRMLQGICTHTDADLWERSMCRTDFSEERERRAEEFGYFAEEWLQRAPDSTPDLLSNMRNSLETRSAW
ncbi:hypothetical protein E6R60_26900 [Streptomyces sp. A0642]|uniref:hypothetical protein n=1 Tax=Streptomyces sp. A0642 TaxID=2563100 RepID=UPI0010A2A0D1|nr:hypothetical protein [Streptomyces sp. A0642]THA72560.1 hypothetical protein E6R60_26900 [Streptomyces sp. A0642]